MTVIDDRGRLFGIVNLIDALVVVVILGLVPLAYGAYVLFRVPEPTIDSIEPARIVEKSTTPLKLTGTNLRAFLNVRIGPAQSPAFLLQSTTIAEVRIPPELKPGTYDLALYDEAQELVRKPGAVTITPPPVPPQSPQPRADVQVVGAFVGLQSATELFKKGLKFERPVPKGLTPEAQAAIDFRVGEVLAVRSAEPGTERVRTAPNVFINARSTGRWRVPAIVVVNCTIVNSDCKLGDTTIAPSAMLTLPYLRPRTAKDPPQAASSGEDDANALVPDQVRFAVDEVRLPDAPPIFPSIRTAIATLTVRFISDPEVADALKVGDVDLGNVNTATPTPPSDRATLTALGSDRRTGRGMANMDSYLRRGFSTEQPVTMFTGTLRVPVVLTNAGWSYKDRPVKAGVPIAFDTIIGGTMGWIIDMKVSQEKERFLP